MGDPTGIFGRISPAPSYESVDSGYETARPSSTDAKVENSRKEALSNTSLSGDSTEGIQEDHKVVEEKKPTQMSFKVMGLCLGKVFRSITESNLSNFREAKGEERLEILLNNPKSIIMDKDLTAEEFTEIVNILNSLLDSTEKQTNLSPKKERDLIQSTKYLNRRSSEFTEEGVDKYNNQVYKNLCNFNDSLAQKFISHTANQQPVTQFASLLRSDFFVDRLLHNTSDMGLKHVSGKILELSKKLSNNQEVKDLLLKSLEKDISKIGIKTDSKRAGERFSGIFEGLDVSGIETSSLKNALCKILIDSKTPEMTLETLLGYLESFDLKNISDENKDKLSEKLDGYISESIDSNNGKKIPESSNLILRMDLLGLSCEGSKKKLIKQLEKLEYTSYALADKSSRLELSKTMENLSEINFSGLETGGLVVKILQGISSDIGDEKVLYGSIHFDLLNCLGSLDPSLDLKPIFVDVVKKQGSVDLYDKNAISVIEVLCGKFEIKISELFSTQLDLLSSVSKGLDKKLLLDVVIRREVSKDLSLEQVEKFISSVVARIEKKEGTTVENAYLLQSCYNLIGSLNDDILSDNDKIVPLLDQLSTVLMENLSDKTMSLEMKDRLGSSLHSE
ncbi:hypothetical protein N9Y92_00815, partial [Chlamydiales bacterium]|nr:hypothetical protein [Chlamydiales bacterium]